jgi:methyl-accepting chemotaxis protein
MNASRITHPYKRRNYFINKNFQRDFIFRFCALAGLGSVLTMGAIYWLAMNSTTVAIRDGHVAVRTTADYLLPLMFQTVSLELIIGTIATIALTMIISFRIAGPLFRLKMMFQGLAQGDFCAHMQLRRDDQLKDLAQAYNEAVYKLNNKIKALKNISSADEIKRELDNFKTS